MSHMPQPRRSLSARSLAKLGLVVFFAFGAIGTGSLAAGAQASPSLQPPLLDATPSMKGRIDATWAKAAKISLAYDFVARRSITHPTSVLVAQDPSGLDVAFTVWQHAAVTRTQETNGPGVGGDDNVQVLLNPQGVKGFSYFFMANARGARYQSSSENTAYAPHWTAGGSLAPHGYVVTMHIPFSILRSAGSTSWRVQFARYSVASNVSAVWAHAAAQQSYGDPLYDGTLTHVGIGGKGATAHKLPPLRIQPYALAAIAPPRGGGSTSRLGVDLAIPVTPTASLLASLHPDFSNVETDQQTIAPTAFPRQYSEVRPFFTQLSNSFNSTFGCVNCPQTLYTPSIPTFSDGYALEGTQGYYTFGAFDALGAQRSDTAQNLAYARSTPQLATGFEVQRVAVDTAAFHDDTTLFDAGAMNKRLHVSAYANYSLERGSLISNNSQSKYDEEGAVYSTPSTMIILARQHVGAQFSPIDGYVAQSDITGIESFTTTTRLASKRSKLLNVQFSANYGRYTNHLGQLAQASANYQVNVNLKDQLSLHLYQGTSSVLTFDGQYLPFSVNNGAALLYRANTSQPSMVWYASGPYYHGHALNWNYATTLPLRKRLSLNLAVSENLYATAYASETSFKQWQDNASIEWQFSHAASLAVGARRIIGPFLPNAFQPPNFAPVDASNISGAFHYLLGRNEFYIVYGDPNAFATNPTVFLKWIRYIGAEKGT